MADRSPRRILFAALLICFFFSGAAGLVYQVAWGKALGLIFGHTAYAVATVLAVFMGGLAAGSALIGKWTGRWTAGPDGGASVTGSRLQPIALYAWLEFGVAASGALSLAGLAGVRVLYVAAHPYAAGHEAFLVGLRFLGAGVVLFLPTFLMGGTLPVLVHGLARHAPQMGARLARLYWVNTAGAVAGTLAAGFWLLPAIGLRATVGVAVALNLFAGVFALALARGFSAHSVRDAQTSALNPAGRAAFSAGPVSKLLLVYFAVVGATAMAYEIGWTRLLSTQLGSSTYAFTLMLATFLTGIVLGSAAFEWWSRHYDARLSTFAATQTGIALAAIAVLVFFSRLPGVLPVILRATHESFGGLVLAQFVLSALAMLPAAIVFGFNFPVVMVLVAGPRSPANSPAHSNVASAVGAAYAWNTLGAILGAVITGFWLLPRLGSFRMLAATAAVNLAVAALLSLAAEPRRIPAFTINLTLLAAALLAGFSGYFYDRALASFNTVLYWNLHDRPLTLEENARLVDVVYLADGLNSTISVSKTDDYLALRTNGKVDASNHDVTTQLLVGHLGAMAHPAPRRVLLIGFGSGMTLSALARYPEIERLDCVEIEPAVVGAAPLLTSLNRHVLEDPRVRVTLDDARNFLFTTRERYDLIISEPSNPWIAGVATLYTREFYRAVGRRLAPGGIFVQWVQGYSLFPEDLRMVLATFQSEFGGATVWHGDSPDFVLMAPTPPAGEILERIESLWTVPGLREDFTVLGMEEPAGVFGFYMADQEALRKFSSGAPINTDDLTLLEYHAPRALLVRRLEDRNREALLGAQSSALPDGLGQDRRGAVLAAAAATSLNLEDTEGAEHFIRALDGVPTTSRIATVRGRAALARANYDSAFRAFDAALAMDPGSLEAAWGRAEVNRRFGNNDLARRQFSAILERDPNHLRATGSLKQLATDFSRWEEAVQLQRRLIAADPNAGAAGYAELADIYLRAGKLDEAYAAMRECLSRDNYNFQTRLNLGRLFRHQNRWQDAREHLEFVRRYFPDGDPETYTLLHQVYRESGDLPAAAEAVRYGLRMFPDNAELLRLN